MREQLYVLTHWRDGNVTRSADMPPGYAKRFAERMRAAKKVRDIEVRKVEPAAVGEEVFLDRRWSK